MKKQYILVSAILLFGITLFVGTFFLTASHRDIKFAESVINSFGGEALLKGKCIEKHSGDIKLPNGETQKRIMTAVDIIRFEITCDCTIAKIKETIIKAKKQFDHLDVHQMPIEDVEKLENLLLSQYDVCELEMLQHPNKKYKSIKIGE